MNKYAFRPKGHYYCELEVETHNALVGMLDRQHLTKAEGKRFWRFPGIMEVKCCRRDNDGKIVFLLREEGDLQEYEYETVEALESAIEDAWEMFHRTFADNEFGLSTEEMLEQFPTERANLEGWSFDRCEEGLRIDVHGPGCGSWNLPDDALAHVVDKASNGSPYHKTALAFVAYFNKEHEAEERQLDDHDT